MRTAPHWASLREHTFVSGMRLLFWTYRLGGRWPFKLCLYPVVIYYWLTRRAARTASFGYLRRIQSARNALGHTPTWRDPLTHFLAFADTILDKLLAISGRLVTPARADGEELLQALLAQGRGAIIVIGHVGCVELCRVIAARQPNLRMHVLVHTAHAERFNRVLHTLDPTAAVNLIQVTEVNAATAILLADRVAQGEFVAIAGDRVPLFSGATVPALFCGEIARWPVGPYVLAALLKCPLYALGCVRIPHGDHRGDYVLQVRCLAEQVLLPRATRQQALAAHAQQFASWLEDLVAAAPYAWCNFYPFWEQGLDAGPRAAGRDGLA